MGNTYSRIFIHLIFSTKQQAPDLKEEVQQELKSYISTSAEEQELQVLGIGGTENHLHVLLIMPPKYPVSKAAQIIKGGSSNWLNKHHFNKKKFRWQRGYGAFSINKSLVPATIKFINTQKEYHTKTSYQDEFISFLEKHGMEYNRKTLFPEAATESSMDA